MSRKLTIPGGIIASTTILGVCICTSIYFINKIDKTNKKCDDITEPSVTGKSRRKAIKRFNKAVALWEDILNLINNDEVNYESINLKINEFNKVMYKLANKIRFEYLELPIINEENEESEENKYINILKYINRISENIKVCYNKLYNDFMDHDVDDTDDIDVDDTDDIDVDDTDDTDVDDTDDTDVDDTDDTDVDDTDDIDVDDTDDIE